MQTLIPFTTKKEKYETLAKSAGAMLELAGR